ncbi:amino acid ABC transporter substrate-binding protein, partial [Clostridium perfringens]|nr:amino acid ABC transporter substrate-binding protein [Clostridium perfringens]
MKKVLKKLTMGLVVLVIMIGIVACNKKDVDSNDNEIIIGYDNTYFP